MIAAVADNILSPIGLTADENIEAILAGRSALRLHEGLFGLPEPFFGSVFDRTALADIFRTEAGEPGTLTLFEQLCILSAGRAIASCRFDAASPDTIFILSTTKGNVACLADNPDDSRCYLAGSAERITRHFGNPNRPLVVSNACISGVSAQIAAVRELMAGRARHAVIIGADMLSRFIVSGFQSFKALSTERCLPYDSKRTGLNLGEAAGTLILAKCDSAPEDMWLYAAGSAHNDANHISGPSRTGEGSFRVLRDILRSGVAPEEIAFVNAHGTATAYNDEMESIAIERAGLDTLPVNGLKGIFGHTLGAAGVIETILSMHAADRGLVLPTVGFSEQGTSRRLDISAQPRHTERRCFIKILSGFGGSNAGIAYRKGGAQ